MLEWIRTNKRWAQVILALLILPFAFTGMQGYFERNERNRGPAAVGGTEIAQAELDRAVNAQVDRLKATYGDKVDRAMFDTPELRRSVLDQLIDQRVAGNAARDIGLATPDELLRKTIASEPSLQENGAFSLQKYRQLIAAQGATERDFENRIREGLATDQLVSVPTAAARLPAASSAQVVAALGQKRSVQSVVFASADLASDVVPTDEQIGAYYEANKRQFQTQETVAIEYVVLDAASVGAKLEVPESELRSFYEQNQARYVSQEQRDASHILIAVAADAKPDDIARAEKKANEALARVKAAPASFAQVARELSDDPGSRTAGGALGSFGRGAMVKPFEDAVFALQAGQISGLVRTDFGFHIIKLNSVTGGGTRPFAEVRAAIESEVRRQLGKQRFAEAAEQFGNQVYEQPDSLKPVADKLGLTIQRADKLARSGGEGVLGERKLLDAVFSDDAINAHHNTAAIEAGPDRLVSARVVEHAAAQTQPLDAVRPQIVSLLKRQEGAARALQRGRDTVQALKSAQPPTLAFGAVQEVNRLAPTAGLPPAAVAAIFSVDASKLPAYAGAELPGVGFAVYRITAVTDGAIEAPQAQAIGAQYEQAAALAEANALVGGLRSRAKVAIHEAKSR